MANCENINNPPINFSEFDQRRDKIPPVNLNWNFPFIYSPYSCKISAIIKSKNIHLLLLVYVFPSGNQDLIQSKQTTDDRCHFVTISLVASLATVKYNTICLFLFIDTSLLMPWWSKSRAYHSVQTFSHQQFHNKLAKKILGFSVTRWKFFAKSSVN